jgi:hypothetical protein
MGELLALLMAEALSLSSIMATALNFFKETAIDL